MVRITNLTKMYGSFSVLNGLNMNVQEGDVYGFLGKNGCGKSTTMNILCNIIPKDGGDIILGGGSQRKIRVGYLPETPALYGYMNGYEYLRYIAACSNYQGDVEARVREVLDIVGMTEGDKRKIKGYSRVMNQRMGIGAAIFYKPHLLVLDEPTSALDPQGRAEVMAIIRQLTDMGCTIILCTHILSDVERVANKIGILTNGKMALEGGITEIMQDYARSEIELTLYEPNADNVAKIKTLEGQGAVNKVDFYEKTGVFVVRSSDCQSASIQLSQLLAKEGIAVSRQQAVTESLEQIYMKVVNGNA